MHSADMSISTRLAEMLTFISIFWWRFHSPRSWLLCFSSLHVLFRPHRKGALSNHLILLHWQRGWLVPLFILQDLLFPASHIQPSHRKDA